MGKPLPNLSGRFPEEAKHSALSFLWRPDRIDECSLGLPEASYITESVLYLMPPN